MGPSFAIRLWLATAPTQAEMVFSSKRWNCRICRKAGYARRHGAAKSTDGESGISKVKHHVSSVATPACRIIRAVTTDNQEVVSKKSEWSRK